MTNTPTPIGDYDKFVYTAAIAGGKAPTDRVIDGKNIWPILSGQENGDPRDAFFYYQMDQLQAVRSGDWKLFVEMNSKKRNWGKPEGKRELKLFNLASDIHEDDNVAHKKTRSKSGFLRRLERRLLRASPSKLNSKT